MSTAVIESTVYKHLLKNWPNLAEEFKEGSTSGLTHAHTNLDLEEIVAEFNKTCVINSLIYNYLWKISPIEAKQFKSRNFLSHNPIDIDVERVLKELKDTYICDSLVYHHLRKVAPNDYRQLITLKTCLEMNYARLKSCNLEK